MHAGFILIFLSCSLTPCFSRSLNFSREEDVKSYEAHLDSYLEHLFRDYEFFFSDSKFENHGGEEDATHFTNEWLVFIPLGQNYAKKLENETGYKNIGEVRGFPNVFRMIHPTHPEKHKRSARDSTKQLASDNSVSWAEQVFIKKRYKRSLIDDWSKVLKDFRLGTFLHMPPSSPINSSSEEKRFNDVLWEKEWYLYDTRTKESLPKLDLNVIPVFNEGITGKGINIVILDDGIEHTHKDLKDNYNAKISYDLNDDDDDPMPRYGESPSNSHGTRCAGEIAMKANNSVCGVGIAYDAKIGGIRMLDGPISDRIEAESLSYALDKVDIFSASWGPSDNGEVVEGPGRLAQAAFIKGAQHGRGGKGVVYVWASGNGGAKDDSCSCDGYASSIYTLSIGSATEAGVFPWYGEKCPSTMAVTYSSGAYTDQKIATTDINDKCTTGHTGTSASAPLAAGIVALVFEANPRLSWRDVQHLVVWSSEPSPLLNNKGWFQNGAGFKFHSGFGFGLMDAHAIVSLAKNWTNVGPQRICHIKTLPQLAKKIGGKEEVNLTLESDGCFGTSNEVLYLEHLELLTTIRYNKRGALRIVLTSPSGTLTDLLVPRKNDVSSAGFSSWPFMSVSTWGENPKGNWTLSIIDSTKNEENGGYLDEANLVLYGTVEMPEILRNNKTRTYATQNHQKNKKSLSTRDEEEEFYEPEEVVEKTNQLNRILEDLQNDFFS